MLQTIWQNCLLPCLDSQLPYEVAMVEIIFVATNLFLFQHTDNDNYITGGSCISQSVAANHLDIGSHPFDLCTCNITEQVLIN